MSAKVIKINQVNAELDEVFFYSEEPYENFVRYVEHGTYELDDEFKPEKVLEMPLVGPVVEE